MNIYLVAAIGAIFYFIVPYIIIVYVNKSKVSNFLMNTLFLLFLGVLFVGIYFKVSFANNMVYAVPDFSKQWFNKPINLSFKNIEIFDLVINTIMLIPVGIFCRYSTRNKLAGARFATLIIVAVVSGILTELGQFILPIPRGVQLSDTLLNIASVLIGGVIGCIFFAIRKSIRRRK